MVFFALECGMRGRRRLECGMQRPMAAGMWNAAAEGRLECGMQRPKAAGMWNAAAEGRWNVESCGRRPLETTAEGRKWKARPKAAGKWKAVAEGRWKARQRPKAVERAAERRWKAERPRRCR